MDRYKKKNIYLFPLFCSQIYNILEYNLKVQTKIFDKGEVFFSSIIISMPIL